MKRKLLSLALALVMALSLLPAGAMAAEDVPEEGAPVEEAAPVEETAPAAGETAGAVGSAEVAAITPKMEKTVTEATASEPRKTVVTVTPANPISWSDVDANAGRTYAGWWVGIDIIAPASVTDSTLSKAIFYKDRASGSISFLDKKDGVNAEGRYHMTAWSAIPSDYEYKWTDGNGQEKKGTFLERFDATGKRSYDLGYTWYFNWDGDTTTGKSVEYATDAAGAKATVEGIDEIITLRFDVGSCQLLDKTNKQDVFWPATKVEASGGDYSDKTDDLTDAVASAAASTTNTTVTVTAGDDSGTAAATLPAAVFTAAKDANNSKLALTVESGTAEAPLNVTLDKGALDVVAGKVSSGSVTITAKDVKSDTTVTDKPANAVAAYQVEVKAGGTAITGGEWTSSGITLTVPAPKENGTAIDVKDLTVYLDGTADASIKPVRDGNNIKITVPHLTVVALARSAGTTPGDTVEVGTLDALKTALSGSTAAIRLTADITTTETLKVERAVAIDFDGNKVSGGIGGGKYIFEVGKGSGSSYETMTVEFKNAKIENTQTSNGRCLEVKPGVTMNVTGDGTEVKGSGNTIVNAGTLNIDGGTYTCTDTNIARNVILTGSDVYKDQSAAAVTNLTNAVLTNNAGLGASALWGATVNVKTGTSITAHGNALGGNNTTPPQNLTVEEGAALTSTDDAAIYQAAAGTLTITGGTITGKAGVVVRSGTVTITGGTITANGTGTVKVGDKTAEVPASGIVYDLDTNYNGSSAADSKITVGGNAQIKAADGQEAVTLVTADGDTTEPASKLEVTGGTFDKPVDPKYLDDTLKYQAQTGAGMYSYHATEAAATTAAGSGGTVVEVDKINANLDLKIESRTTDVSLYAKVEISGMESDKVYMVRLAKDQYKNNGEMTILIVTGVTGYSVYCKDGQPIWVFEYAQKSDIKPGEALYTSMVSGTAAKS